MVLDAFCCDLNKSVKIQLNQIIISQPRLHNSIIVFFPFAAKVNTKLYEWMNR